MVAKNQEEPKTIKEEFYFKQSKSSQGKSKRNPTNKIKRNSHSTIKVFPKLKTKKFSPPDKSKLKSSNNPKQSKKRLLYTKIPKKKLKLSKQT
jgi:hypothetical protein